MTIWYRHHTEAQGFSHEELQQLSGSMFCKVRTLKSELDLWIYEQMRITVANANIADESVVMRSDLSLKHPENAVGETLCLLD